MHVKNNSLQNPIFIKPVQSFTPGFKAKAINSQMVKQQLISAEKIPSRGALGHQQDRGIFGSSDRPRAAISNPR
jgi:hypothetical protein